MGKDRQPQKRARLHPARCPPQRHRGSQQAGLRTHECQGLQPVQTAHLPTIARSGFRLSEWCSPYSHTVAGAVLALC